LDRQKITLKDSKNILPDDITLKVAGVAEGGELSVKDLGPQISWKTVFMVEYVSVLYDSWLRATDAPSPGWPTVHPPSDLLLPQDILWWSCASQHASTVFTCISGLNDMLKRDQLCVCICHPALRQT
jgi:hypothetical protein